MTEGTTNDERIIYAQKGSKYLGDVIKEIPSNVMFDKGLTGCGGTELEINAERHSIIAVPYKSLIDNKRRESLMGVYSGIEDVDIVEYLNNNTIKFKKIMVTYDSINKVIRCINKSGLQINGEYANAEKDFFLLIDEYHLLFSQYDFRNDAVTNLIRVFPKFNNKTFMSATPLETEFLLEELLHLPIIRVKWQDIPQIRVKPIEAKSPANVIIQIIKQRLENKSFANLHIFVNSVTTIARIISALPLDSDKVKIVCSEKEINQHKLGSVYKIERDLRTPKLINFYTSTVFEGVDISDINGKTFIVSDGKLAHTLVDISSLFIQICGRIRDSKYNSEVTHIYSKTHRYNDSKMTFQEYKAFREVQMNKDVEYVKYLNALPEGENKKRTIAGILSNNSGNVYLNTDENHKVYFDKNRVKLDMMNFKIMNSYRKSATLEKNYKENGFNVEELTISDTLKAKSNSKISFKKLFEEYTKLVANKDIGNREERMRYIELEKPQVKQAYDHLGIDEVRRMKYSVRNITKKLSLHIDDSENVKIKKLISDRVLFNKPNKIRDIIQIIQSAYDMLSIKRKAKSTDLEKWFTVKRESIRYSSEVNKMVTLLGPKYILD